MEKKEFPDKVTKSFFYKNYSKQTSEKRIRSSLNYYFNLLGFNKRKKIVPDIIVIYYLLGHGFPEHYKISRKLELQFKKLNIVKVKKNYGYLYEKC